MNIGDRIKSIREKNGISISMLAEMANVSRATVAGIESGQKVPRGASVHAIALALETTANYLLTGHGEEPRPIEAARPWGLRKAAREQQEAAELRQREQDKVPIDFSLPHFSPSIAMASSAWDEYFKFCLKEGTKQEIFVRLERMARRSKKGLGLRDVHAVLDGLIAQIDSGSDEAEISRELKRESSHEDSSLNGEEK